MKENHWAEKLVYMLVVLLVGLWVLVKEIYLAARLAAWWAKLLAVHWVFLTARHSGHC